MNLVMRNVEFPASLEWNSYHSFVANVFWRQGICKVSSVTLIPYDKHGGIFYLCLVKVKEWVDSECAYNFIIRLKDSSRETRIIYDNDNWWVAEINEMYNDLMFLNCYTVKFQDIDFNYDNDDDDEQEEDDDISKPPTLTSQGNYFCASCGESQGGMLSMCRNEDCKWFGKSFTDIAFSNENNTKNVDAPPTMMPPASWLQDETQDVAPTIMPPDSWLKDDTTIPLTSWLKCGIDLEDIQDEWVQISTKSSNNNVAPVVMPPASWLINDVPQFSDTNKYFCGFCGETKRGIFSICWNKTCKRYGKSIDDIYEENFNLDIKNVTLRKHQQSFRQEVS